MYFRNHQYSKLIFGLISKNFGYGGNGEAYQAPTSTRPLGITRSVPGLCGYQAKDYYNVVSVNGPIIKKFVGLQEIVNPNKIWGQITYFVMYLISP